MDKTFVLGEIKPKFALNQPLIFTKLHKAKFVAFVDFLAFVFLVPEKTQSSSLKNNNQRLSLINP